MPGQAFGGLLDTFGKIGLIGLGVGAIGSGIGAIAGVLTGPISAASDLSESINKVNVVFGTAAGGVLDFGKTAAQGLGMSRRAATEAAGTFGNLFVSMGLNQGKAAELSTKILTLGSDLASFNNIKPEEALEKLRAGLVGESEPLRALGVNLNEAMVKAQGMKMGLADANGELSESAKVQARYALILEQTKTAQGDFTNTSTGMANAMRIINASFADVQSTIGEQLLPVIAPLISAFAKGLPDALAIVQPYLDAFGKIVGEIGPSLGEIWTTGKPTALIDIAPFATALYGVGESFRTIAKAFAEGGLGAAFGAWVLEAQDFGIGVLTWIGEQVTPILTKLGEWGGAFVDWIGPKIPGMLRKLGEVVAAALRWVGEQVHPILTKLGTWGAAFVAWVKPMVEPMLTEVGKLAMALGTWITDTAAPQVLGKLGEWGKQFTAWIGPATTDFLAAWPANLTRFLDWIEKDAAPAIYRTLASWVTAFTKWVGGGTEDGTASGGLFKTIGNIAGVIFEFIGKTAEVLGPRLLSWAGAFLGWVVTSVIPFLAVELGKMLLAIGTWLVTDAIPWAGRAFFELGKAIVMGIVAGIKAAPGAIADAIRSVSPFSISVPVVAAPAAPNYDNTPPQWRPPVNVGGSGSSPSVVIRDSGGPGYAGQSYLIGTGAQPERFVPDRPGHFYPNAGGGGGPTTIPVYIGGDLITTVVAKANKRYADRGGR